MNSTVGVSVIIPNHNRVDALPLTLEALNRQTYPADRFEVILVDQASSDGSAEFAGQLATAYKLILLEQRGKSGASNARNAGAAAAAHPLLLFLDSDIILEADALEQHVQSQAEHPGAYVSGHVRPYPGTYQSFIEKSANPEVEFENSEVSRHLPFYLAFSNLFSIPLEVFKQVGGFDPGLHAIEDIEFAYRVEKTGAQIWYCAEAVGYHYHQRNLIERLERARAYCRYLPGLYLRYPEWQGAIPGYRDFDKIDWSEDSARWVARKLLTRMISQKPMRISWLKICQALEKQRISSRATRFMFWRLLQAYGYVGYQDGKKVIAANTV